jgi:putative transposase
VIDVFMRRVKYLVAPSESADSACLLLRRAIVEYGVPERVRGDNGAAFASRRFQSALDDLKIEYEACLQYSPEKKGFIERAIGVMAQSLLERLTRFQRSRCQGTSGAAQPCSVQRPRSERPQTGVTPFQ